MSDDRDRYPETDVTSPGERDESFLNRWSRRKHEAREVEGRAEQAEDPDRASRALAEVAQSQPPELTDADMPSLESLDEDSDYRGFLSPKVSEELRRAALRKLFRLSRFNVCDGLDDYAEDFTQFEPLGELVTHEMRRVLAREGEKLTAALESGSGQTDPAPRLVAADEPSVPPDPDPPLASLNGGAEEPAGAEMPDGPEELQG